MLENNPSAEVGDEEGAEFQGSAFLFPAPSESPKSVKLRGIGGWPPFSSVTSKIYLLL